MCDMARCYKSGKLYSLTGYIAWYIHMLYSITICYIALNIARAFARWAVQVVSAARRRSSYLCPIKAEKVPESTSVSNNLICKSKVPVHWADVVHIAMVKAMALWQRAQRRYACQSVLTLVQAEPLRIGRHTKWSPSICTGHDSPVVVQAAHWEANIS